MDDVACRALDAAPARGQILLSHLPGGTCRVDLAQMTQTNVRTGTRRRIRRGAAPAPPAAATTAATGLAAMRGDPSQHAGRGSITVRAPDGRLVRVRVPRGRPEQPLPCASVVPSITPRQVFSFES